MPSVKMQCDCGKVRGHTDDINPQSGNRIHCCCADCQSFASLMDLEKKRSTSNQIVDEFGGTDIFQMPIAYVNITEGNEHIACLRLSHKGLYRWYTTCCHTPIGNTLDGKMPFIGIIHNFMDKNMSRDSILGRSKGYIHCQHSTKVIPEELKGSYFKIAARIVSKLLVWKIKGLNQPSSFFTSNKQPVVIPKILK